MNEKQAWIVGGGAVAVLLLTKGKLSAAGLKAIKKPAAKLGGGAAGKVAGKVVSSANRPSANIATANGRATGPQIASTVGLGRTATVVAGSESVLTSVLDFFRTRRPAASTAPAPAKRPGAPPTQPQKGSGPNMSGGSGGGNPGSGALPPGGNPWAADGSFVGRSTVTGNAPSSGGALQGYDTGVSSSDYNPTDYNNEVYVAGQSPSASGTDALAQARSGGMDPDGSITDDPSALQYDDQGVAVMPVYDAGNAPPASGMDDSGGYYTEGGDYVPGQTDWPMGPIDTVPLETSADYSSNNPDYSGGGGYDYSDQTYGAGAIPDTSYDGDVGFGGGEGFNDMADWGD